MFTRDMRFGQGDKLKLRFYTKSRIDAKHYILKNILPRKVKNTSTERMAGSVLGPCCLSSLPRRFLLTFKIKSLFTLATNQVHDIN